MSLTDISAGESFKEKRGSFQWLLFLGGGGVLTPKSLYVGYSNLVGKNVSGVNKMWKGVCVCGGGWVGGGVL